ncbi:MAG: diguanylate cyclase [Acidimicrobiales bacterium]
MIPYERLPDPAGPAVRSDRRSAGFPSTAGAGLEIVGVLGRGGQATVYEARGTDDPGVARAGDRSGPEPGRHYALKLLNVPAEDPADAVRSFGREAALLAMIDDPGVPKVHALGSIDRRPYLVADLAAGRNLRELIEPGPMAPPRALAVTEGVLEALAAAHRAGVLHRDVKPENIVVGDDGMVRLVDFGLAGRVGGALGRRRDDRDAVVGTLAYAAPEQAGMLRRSVDERSDLYAVGVVLFEMLAGRPPFTAADVGRLLRSHAVEPPPDLQVLAPAVDPELRSVVERLLAKDPDDRYPSAVEVLDAVRGLPAAVGPGQPVGRRPAPPHRRGRRLGGGAGLVGRHRPLAALERRWSRAVAGTGGLALVRGPAGVGKTALVRALADRVEAGGGLVLSGKGSADDPTPLGPLRAALDEWLDQLRLRTDPAAVAALADVAVAAHQAGPLIAVVGPSLVDGHDRIEGDRSGQLPGVVAGFLIDLADRFDGLLLHLDDVQWLDTSTVRVVEQLAAEVADHRLLVVGTARVEPAAEAAVDRFVAVAGGRLEPTIELRPFTDDEVAELVRLELPGAHLDEGISRALAARGDGNPFVVREFLRAVVDAGLLTPDWGRWRLDEAGLRDLELPEDVLGLVLSRVDGIGRRGREVLTVGAALGARFDPDIVVEVIGTADSAEVRHALADATDRHLLEPRGPELAFVHDRVREALLDPLDPDGAARLHLCIARALDRRWAEAATGRPGPGGVNGRRATPDLVYALAQHYLQAGDQADRRRVHETCREAGELAASEQAPEVAVPFFAAAHAAGAGDHGFLLHYGSALREAGDFTEAVHQLEASADAAPTAVDRAEALLELADVHVASWATADAYRLLREVLALVGRPVPDGGIAMARAVVADLLNPALTRRRADRNDDRLFVRAHNISVYVGGQDLALGRMLFHSACAALGARRLARTNPEYVIAVAGFGTALGTAGLRRLSEWTLRRSERAADAVDDPHLQALVSWCWGITAYLANWDDGAAWAHTINRHGRWLDTAKYLDATASLGAHAGFLGLTDDLMLWNALGRRRVAAAPSLEFAALVTYDALIAYQQGRFADGAREMTRIHERFGAPEARGARLILLLTKVRGLLEQDDIGPEFDAAAEEMYRLAGGPARMVRQFRDVTVYHALGLLSWARRVPDEERRERIAAAGRAVRRAGRDRRSSQVMAAQPILEADLLLLTGRPEEAWRTVAAWRPPQPDAPLLSYEAARVRARALLALGHQGEAARTAAMARDIAAEQGWRQRVRIVEAEFSPTDLAPHGADRSVPVAGRVSDPGGVPGASGRYERQVDALEQVSHAVAQVVDPDEVARVALEQIITLLNAERAFLFLATEGDDQGEDGLVQRLGRDEQGADLAVLTGYSASVVERVRETREALVVTGSDEGEAIGARSMVQHGLRSIMAAPLELDGRLLGVVYLDSQLAKGIFTADDVGVLRALCTPIATVLETSRAYRLEASVDAERRRRDLAEALRDSASQMAASETPLQVLRVLTASTVAALGADRAWVVLQADDGGLELVGDRGGDGEGSCGLAAGAVGLRRLVASTRITSGRPGEPPPWDALAGRHWLAHPLAEVGSGAQLVIAADQPADDDQREVLAVLATQASTAYTRAALLQRVQLLATRDELTGLANRRHLFDLGQRMLDEAGSDGPGPAAVMVDIDFFKQVNDDHGHLTGDDVIRGVASRLQECVGPDDVIGRYGGEEFVVLLADGGEVAAVTDRLLDALRSTPVLTRSGDLPVRVSVGGTVRHRTGNRPESLESVLGRADDALYRAKQAGRNRAVVL